MGIVYTTANRNWELNLAPVEERLRLSRALAVDMESATVAANGFRYRIPTATLLAVSDKPLHAQPKLSADAQTLLRGQPPPARRDRHLGGREGPGAVPGRPARGRPPLRRRAAARHRRHRAAQLHAGVAAARLPGAPAPAAPSVRRGGVPGGPYDQGVMTHGPEPNWLGRVDRWTRSHSWAADALATLAVLAVLGALSVGGAQGIRWSAGWVAALIACFAVLHLTVAVRSRAPEAAFLVAAAAMLVIVFAPDGRVTDRVPGGPTHVPALFLPSSLVFLLVLYSAASWLAAVRSRVALAIALAGVAIATRLTTGTLRQLTAGGGWPGSTPGSAWRRRCS